MKLTLFLIFMTPIFALSFKDKEIEFYQKGISQIHHYEVFKIEDPISDIPINVEVKSVFAKSGELLGYIRDIKTTTGCDSACLPVVFTLFYDRELTLVKLLSKPGLTKKFHAKFTTKDYEKLDLILLLNPSIFKKVRHPTEMVDAISGATKKAFKKHVVKNAAYTSLRVNLYHQQTLSELKKRLSR